MLFVIAAWALVAVAGATKLTRFNLTPTAAAATPPTDWPVGSGISPAYSRPTLVIFVHPQCPCSRASLGELAQLLDRTGGRLSTIVVFAQPQLLESDPMLNALWKAAFEMPGTTLVRDPSGSIAQHFDARSSGQTFLFDTDGRLRFSGGITAARGQRGDNAGIAAINAALLPSPLDPRNAIHSLTTSPVFGCSLE